MKKLTTQDIEILQDPDEDFVPSESDDDDEDDDENYLPEHDRRPYNRSNGVNGNVSRGTIGRDWRSFLVLKGFILGRGRGGRGHLTSTNTRLPPSTHFVRPQPLVKSHSRSQLYSSSVSSMHRHRSTDSLAMELERTYAAALPRYYGTRQGQTTTATDYGDFRISMNGRSCALNFLIFSII